MEKTEQKTSKKKESEKTEKSSSENLAEKIKAAADGLYYLSETDAEITAFVGLTAVEVSKKELLKQTGAAADAKTVKIEEKSFADFFARLTKVQDWYGDEEKAAVEKFIHLKEILENNIRDLKVFRVGEVEINIYAVGLDAENTFLGIETKAVET